ncbi:uncharacterized protein LOC144864865 [Branchiostoma floridae x Branchiostoma japonicum]
MSGPASAHGAARGWAAMMIVLTGLALAQAEELAGDNRYPYSAQTADPLRDFLQQYSGSAETWLPAKRVAEYVFGHGRTNDLENRQRMAWLYKVINSLESAGSKS